jgi:DNA-binding MarR family transcriptional regulator
LADELREVIGRFVRSVRTQAGTPSDAHGETLAYLERAGPVSIAVLADARGVKHQSMRLVTTRLEAEGLIELLPDPKDKRGYRIHVTQAGLRETATDRTARAQWIAKALAEALDEDERDILRQAVPVLKKLVDLAQG